MLNHFRWEVRQIDDRCCVATFHIDNQDLQSEELSEIQLPLDAIQSEILILSGRGPLWLFSYLANLSTANILAIHEPRYQDGETLVAVIVDDLPSNRVGDFLVVDLSSNSIGITDSIVATVPEPCGYDWVVDGREAYILLQIAIHPKSGTASFLSPRQLKDLRLPLATASDDRVREGVVLSGTFPPWIYARLSRLAAQSQVLWFGCDYPLQGTYVISFSDTDSVKVGTGIPADASNPKNVLRIGGASTEPLGQPMGYAIAIVGPANSGKSVLSHGINDALRNVTGAWLTRATPDASAMYNEESHDPRATTKLRYLAKRSWEELGSSELAKKYSEAILRLRTRGDWLFVDTGGQVTDELRTVLKSCTHAILLTPHGDQHEPRRNEFRSACEQAGLAIIADLRSDISSDARTDLENCDGVVSGTVANLHRGSSASAQSSSRIAKTITDLLPRK